MFPPKITDGLNLADKPLTRGNLGTVIAVEEPLTVFARLACIMVLGVTTLHLMPDSMLVIQLPMALVRRPSVPRLATTEDELQARLQTPTIGTQAACMTHALDTPKALDARGIATPPPISAKGLEIPPLDPKEIS